jgi:prolyl oligopeptidase
MRALTPVFLLLFLAAGSACNERNDPVKPERAEGEDPYRWLEDPTAPKVQAWITEQNERAEKALAAFPEGQAIAERVRALATTSVDRFGPKMAGGELFYLRNTPPEPQPVLVARTWPAGDERTLVDVNSEGGNASITGYWPSPTGRFVAYGVAYGGSELTTIHFRDVANGTKLEVSLPNAGGGTSPATLAWDADERGVTYMRWPGAPSGAEVRLFDAALYHHALESGGSDAPTFGEGFSPIAEYELLTSPDAKRVALLAKTGDGGPWEVYLRSKDRFERVLDQTHGVTSATFVGDRLLAVVTGDAPRGRVVAIEDQGQVQDLLAQGDWAIQSLAPVGRGFLVVRTWGPDWRVDHHDAQGKLVRHVALPASGIQVEDIASETGAEQVILSCSGWTTPRRWLRYDARNGDLTPVFEVKPAADYSHVVVERLDGRSPDGTAVPVTLVRLDSRAKDGMAPTILDGYGGFGVPFAPRFIGSRLAWLERGGVLAFATLRGGNEFGEDWHEAGKGAHKQNVFDDFHAAARALIDAGWTAPERLGARGASNGGLLMGAQVTQHPETYRAVVSFVGIYDMLRHETFPNGAYNVTEYGSIKDPAQLAVLRAYSPLQHVQPKTAYPAVLLETGANDPRVAPWQSRKFAAALQAATMSDRPILIVTRTDAGHGVGAPFSQRVGNEALALTFFAHELGANGG